MTDKKKLDFDFFADDTKKSETSKVTDTKEKLNAVTTSASVTDPGEKLGFFEFFKACYSNFVQFSEKHLTKKNPQYLLLAAWLVGVGTAADRLTAQDYTSWGEIWAVVLFGGVISGALTYYIAGWFFNLRVKWSKGRDDIDTSRNINIFATLPISVASILALFFNQMSYGSDYFGYYYSDGTTVDGVFFFVAVAVIIYSIRISYKAAREVLGAEKNRAIGWFIVLPAVFYSAIVLLTLATL